MKKFIVVAVLVAITWDCKAANVDTLQTDIVFQAKLPSWQKGVDPKKLYTVFVDPKSIIDPKFANAAYISFPNQGTPMIINGEKHTVVRYIIKLNDGEGDGYPYIYFPTFTPEYALQDNPDNDISLGNNIRSMLVKYAPKSSKK